MNLLSLLSLDLVFLYLYILYNTTDIRTVELNPCHVLTGYVEERRGRPEDAPSLPPHQLGQARLSPGVAELRQPRRLLRLPALSQPLPPLPQLVLQLLLLVISGHRSQSQPLTASTNLQTYFSKLLTMTGSGRDIVRAPLTAVKVPTNFPSPETGKMSP